MSFSYGLVTEMEGYDDHCQKTPGTRFLQTYVFNWNHVAARCFEKLCSKGFFKVL